MEFAYDYHQLYVYDAGEPPDFSGNANPYIDALDAATTSGLTIGVSGGVVDVLMPRQENFAAGLEITRTEKAPELSAEADHAVEFDLISSGRIRLEGSGGAGELEFELPAGRYRARLCGFGFDAARAWSYSDPGHPGDHYRLEVWISANPAPPVELKRWSGYA